MQRLYALVLGAALAAGWPPPLEDRTPSGLWPSDHAGVVGSFRLLRRVAHR